MRGFREIKALMVACLALYPLMVAFGNITDREANFVFLQHVMSMDTTFPDNPLMYRAVTSPTLQRLAYALIIAFEALCGLALAWGAIALWRARRASAAQFAAAKLWTAIGGFLGFLVWFVGFSSSPANGSPCGNRRIGTARKPPSASSSRSSS